MLIEIDSFRWETNFDLESLHPTEDNGLLTLWQFSREIVVFVTFPKSFTRNRPIVLSDLPKKSTSTVEEPFLLDSESYSGIPKNIKPMAGLLHNRKLKSLINTN